MECCLFIVERLKIPLRKRPLMLIIILFYKMKIKYVLLISCFLGFLGTEGKKDIVVKVKGSEINIGVLGGSEVKTFFFSTDIGEKCGPDYTFVQSQDKNGTFEFRIDVKKKLFKDDPLRILGVFETENEVITETYDLIIGSHGEGIEKGNCSCERSQTEMFSKTQKCAGALIFKEDFDLNFSNWTHEQRSRIYDSENDREFVAFMNDPKTNYIKDGYLHIIARWANYTNSKPFVIDGCTTIKDIANQKKDCGPLLRIPSTLPPVHSAKLHTLKKFQFKYGRVEIRARMPIGDWLFPYLILQPASYHSEDIYVNQLRIAFRRSNALLQNKNAIPISGSRLFGSAVIWTSNKHSEYV
ncbi:gram-negative bacteria-binding protein 2-like isoform X2 [Drosophila hydei]|nr:gram-negative bacteria-binding protein 2-like isoform X2 [Drosophila hydei]